jgi:hypothetical protein
MESAAGCQRARSVALILRMVCGFPRATSRRSAGDIFEIQMQITLPSRWMTPFTPAREKPYQSNVLVRADKIIR